MAKKGIVFNTEDAKRISDAVKQIEKTPRTGNWQQIGALNNQKDRWQVQIGAPRGNGKYDGVLLKPRQSAIDPDTDLEASEFGEPRAPEDTRITVLVINRNEIGTGTNSLEMGRILGCDIIRRPTAEDPQIVVAVEAYGSRVCDDAEDPE